MAESIGASVSLGRRRLPVVDEVLEAIGLQIYSACDDEGRRFAPYFRAEWYAK